MADNYVFKNLIWKFAGLNLILSAIGKWYTFQLLSGTLLNMNKQDMQSSVYAQKVDLLLRLLPLIMEEKVAPDK
jgi:hypothetical protein